MSAIEIERAKFAQPLHCRCGRLLSGGDIKTAGERIEIICSACHASVLEIECLLAYEEDTPW